LEKKQQPTDKTRSTGKRNAWKERIAQRILRKEITLSNTKRGIEKVYSSKGERRGAIDNGHTYERMRETQEA